MKKYLVLFACMVFIFICFYDVQGFVSSGRQGLSIFYLNVLPVLFPFFFVTSMLVQCGLFTNTPAFMSKSMHALYNTDGKAAPVLLLSLLGGFPTGARLISDLYDQNEISRNDAIKIATFTSTTSPIFVIATVGAVLLGSVKLGVVIFVAIVAGALLNGLIYRQVRFNDSISKDSPSSTTATKAHQNQPRSLPDAFVNSLTSAMSAILSIGGIIVIFFIIGNQISSLLNLSATANAILLGVLEMTTAVFATSSLSLHDLAQVVAYTAVLSFGGLCIAVQGFIYFNKFNMPFWFYILYKITHMMLSVFCILIIFVIFV